MRASDHPEYGEDDERRVMLVGDSVVYGNHFLDQSETIAYQMQAYLQVTGLFTEKCSGRVMPAAASSWGPINQREFLSKFGLLNADVGIVVLSSHDLYDVPSGSSLLPYRTRSPKLALIDAWQIMAERFSSRHRNDVASLSREERAALSLSALKGLVTLFEESSTPLMLAYHPAATEHAGTLKREHAVFRDWAEEMDIPFAVLISPELSEVDYRDHIHPTSSGARKLASLLSELAIPVFQPCNQ